MLYNNELDSVQPTLGWLTLEGGQRQVSGAVYERRETDHIPICKPLMTEQLEEAVEDLKMGINTSFW